MVRHNLAKVGVASSANRFPLSYRENGSFAERPSYLNYAPLLKSFFPFALHKLLLHRNGATNPKVVAAMAGWQSGYAAACKAVDAGSIPTPASSKINHELFGIFRHFLFFRHFYAFSRLP